MNVFGGTVNLARSYLSPRSFAGFFHVRIGKFIWLIAVTTASVARPSQQVVALVDRRQSFGQWDPTTVTCISRSAYPYRRSQAIAFSMD
jgi:hypothetical protein